MNEKIKELAEKAGCKVLDDGDWYIPTANGLEKIVYTHGVGLEKFAELIIHECIQICDESRLDYLSHRKSAHDPEDRLVYNEGIAASDNIKYKIVRKLGCGSYGKDE